MVRCLSLLIICILLFKFNFSQTNYPIVFVPGFLCSILEVRINTTIVDVCPKSLHNQWTVLWLNVRLFEPEYLLCFHKIFAFIYNETTNEFVNENGIETRVVSHSNKSLFLDGLLWEYVGLDLFRNHFIEKYHYKDGIDLRSIAYDFRRGNKQSLSLFNQQLKQLIESTFTMNNNKSIYLISHSLGGSMSLQFLSEQNQLWKDQYIRGWISLSGNLAGGIDNIENVVKGFVSPLIPSKITQTWDFFSWRLPEPIVYDENIIIVQTPSKNYTAKYMFQLLNDLNAKQLAQVYVESSLIIGSLPSPNVNTYCFFGANISTPIAYSSTTDTFDKLETIYGLGDGELDYKSLMSCQLWNSTMNSKYKLVIEPFTDVTHIGMVGNKMVLQKIDEILFDLIK